MSLKCLLTLAVASCAFSAFAQSTEGDFDSNGVKIHYATEGQGEPVVLIHGWMADSTMWGRDAKGNTKLSPLPGFELIALDCRGHGKSDKPHDSSKYGTEIAEDVIRLLDHLNIKKAHLLGYSMGAEIAGYIAVKHPDRVISVIYADQAPIITGTQTSAGSNEVEIFAKAVNDGKGLGPYIMYVMPENKMTMDQANSLGAYMMNGKDQKAIALAGLTLGDLKVTPDELKKCTAPSLFIYGGAESHYVTDSVEIARKVLTNSEVKVVAGGTHMTTLIKPDFSATIVAFLQAHKSK